MAQTHEASQKPEDAMSHKDRQISGLVAQLKKAGQAPQWPEKPRGKSQGSSGAKGGKKGGGKDKSGKYSRASSPSPSSKGGKGGKGGKDMAKVQCFLCNEFGHMKRDCPQNKDGNGLTARDVNSPAASDAGSGTS